MGKEKKSKGQKLDIHAFNKMGGPTRRSGLDLPTAPGALPSGPGQGGRGYGRGRRQGGGYNQDGPSRSDASNQWRRNGPRQGGQSSFGDRDRNRDRGGYNRDRGDREHRERREEPESKYGDDFGRSNFGTKKATGATRINMPSRSGGGFGNRPMNNRMGDSDRTMDRGQFGSKMGQAPVRSGGFNNGPPRSGGFNNNSGFRSQGGYQRSSSSMQSRKGDFDGSGSGFGAHLVEDLLNNTSSNAPDEMGRRMNYFDAPKKTGSSRFARMDDGRDPSQPWGSSVSRQTATITAKTAERRRVENANKSAAEAKAQKEQDARESDRQEKEDAKNEKKRQKEAVAQREREREEHLANLRQDVVSMFEEAAPRDLTREHLEVVMPQLDNENNLSEDAARILGTALALTVLSTEVSMMDAIDYIPNVFFDETLVSMLSALCTRMGDMSFVNEVQSQGVDVFELSRDKKSIEQRLIDNDLKCLVSDNETESKLDESFENHISLTELYELINSFEDLPLDLLPKVVSYIFDEYFTNQDVTNPEAYFTSQPLFETLSSKMGGQLEIVDSGVKSWYANGQDPTNLLPMFDYLLRTACLFPEGVLEWQQEAEIHDAKSTAMFCEIDEERTFNDWIMTVEEEYEYEEYDDDYDDDEDDYDTTQTFI